MKYAYALTSVNAVAIGNKLGAVEWLYPGLIKSIPVSRCKGCSEKRKGRAILSYILNDANLAKKDRKLLATVLPASVIRALNKGELL